MLTSELDFDLPPELIATRPAEPRDACRLLVVSRSDPARLQHLHFFDLPKFFSPGDVTVFNTSRVLPAKIQGIRADTGGAVEGLFVRAAGASDFAMLPPPAEGAVAPRVDDGSGADAGMEKQQGYPAWIVMLRSNSRLRSGQVVRLNDARGAPTDFTLLLYAKLESMWLVAVTAKNGAVDLSPVQVLAAVGATPIPPYIRKARQDARVSPADDQDRAWYQTVYADDRSAASVAAPTAGLHFTPGLLDALAAKGIERADLTLDVGLGTFKPVETERLEDHPIHSEHMVVPAAAVSAINHAKRRGRMVACIGTTAVRAVESLPADLGSLDPSAPVELDTCKFILPGTPLHHAQALVTNFHLPRSTLLALVAAFFPQPGGVERLLAIYRQAIKQRYRFYSYGDAMLVLP